MRAPCPDPTERLACLMLLIRTRVAPSPIHGVGVYACETVQPGTTVWRFDPGFDRVIDESELTNAPAAFRKYVDMYAYASSDLGGRLLLPCDHAKFLNHSDTPNTEALSFVSIARCLIEIDDEVTCDYGKFCVGWTGFE
jgi:SET domain-containing protein